jgi:predicted transcriptional regulator
MKTERTGALIKANRNKLGMTQKKLSELIGYSDSRVVYQIESGKMRPPFDKIRRISRALMFDKCLIIESLVADFAHHIRQVSGIK